MNRMLAMVGMAVAVCLAAQACLASHTIMRWRDNRSGAVSVTLDDGLLSQAVTGAHLLNERGLKGTFFITTGSSGYNQWDTYWQDWAALAALGHEIGSHTVTHAHLTNLAEVVMRDELAVSRQAIENAIPFQPCLTIAYPFGDCDELVRQVAAEYYLAARGSRSYVNFYPGEEISPYRPIDFHWLGSRTIDWPGLIPLAELQAYADDAESFGGWFIFHIHSLESTASVDLLAGILDDVAARDVWIAPVSIIVRYMQERINSSLAVVSRLPASITLDLTNSLDASIYKVALTLRSTVPSSWGAVEIDQGASVQVVDPVPEPDGAAVYYDTVPNAGRIMLHPLVMTNFPPEVSAGLDRITTLPADTLLLDGTVEDDGLPNPPASVATAWSMVSGPEPVVFRNALVTDTTVRFPVAGTYVLRLTASDSVRAASDDVTVEVQPAGTVTVAEFVVNTSANDAEEGVSGAVYLNSSDLELVNDEWESQGDQTVGIRFTGVTIPEGANIAAAWIQFTTRAENTEATLLTVRGQAADNAAAFTNTAGNISGRSRTDAQAAWAPAAWHTQGQAADDQRTPGLVPVIQEITRRPGWAGGNALAFIITGTGRRTAWAWDGEAASAPRLHMEYNFIAPAPSDPPEVQLSSAAQSSIGGGAVTISNTVFDADGDTCQLEVLYSTDSGALWTNCFIAGAATTLGSVTISNSNPRQLCGIVTTNHGATATNRLAIVWNTTNSPLPVTFCTNTLVRLRAFDGTHWSDAVTSPPFLVENRVLATVTLEGLSQTYDGTPRIVTPVTGPSGLTVAVTYDGSFTAPTDAGSYAVEATVVEANYRGVTNGVLSIAMASQSITFGPIPDQKTTNTVILGATASSGLPVGFAVASGPASISSGTNLSFAGAGTVRVVASQGGNANWNAAPAVTNIINVTKAAATVTLNGLIQTYDGTPRVVTASTMPTGLAVVVTYNGGLAAPTNAGSYAVTGTVSDVMYAGWTNGTLVVGQAAANVYLQNLAPTYDGTVKNVTATTDPSGLVVSFTYDGSAVAPSNAGNYAVTGTVVNVNYRGVTNGTLNIARANQTIAFGPIPDQKTTNTVILGATASSGLPVGFAVASGPASISSGTNLSFTGAGTVRVVASQAGNANWNAASGVTNIINVTKAAATVALNGLSQTYDGTPRVVTASTTPTGLAVVVTYNGSLAAPTNAGSYAVTGTVSDVMYAGWTNGTLVVTFAQRTLTVVSSRGGEYPGTLTTNDWTTLDQRVTNSPLSAGAGTQYMCVAGAVAGNACTQVAPSHVTLTLTNNAVLTWQWATNYWLATEPGGNGSLDVASGWTNAGASIEITAIAGSNWVFSRWSGDTDGCAAGSNWITVVMSQPRRIMAEFLPLSDVVVDNGDGSPGVSLQGTWSTSVYAAGYCRTNYLHDQNAAKGAKSVTFRPDLSASGTYMVSVWYPAQPINATNVPVDIVSADGIRTVRVNQQVSGGQWVLLGTNRFTAGTNGCVTIRTAGTTNYVMADAVKFAWGTNAPPPPPTVIVDNGDGPASVSLQGAWSASVYKAGYWKDNYLHDQNAAKGAKSVTFRPNLPTNGIYAVSVWYPAQSINAANTPMDIVSAEGTRTVVVNQQVNGGQWVALGTNIFAAGTNGCVTIRTAGTTSYVMADAMKFTWVTNAVPPPPPVIVDNGDGPASVSLQGAWSTSVYKAGYWKDNYLHDQNTDKGAKSVTFRPNLATNGIYAVSVWYPAQPINAADASMDIVSADGTRTVRVNQQVNGSQWVPLGTNRFTAGTNGCVTIRTAGTTSYVMADAMKFTWVGTAGGD